MNNWRTSDSQPAAANLDLEQPGISPDNEGTQQRQGTESHVPAQFPQ